MAADYIEQIRAVQPVGPYHLLGFSFGGVPAHEIAVQLQAQGEQVAALILMDAYPPDEAAQPAGAGDESRESEPPAGVTVWANLVRAEFGHILGGFSDEEVMLFARIFQNNMEIRAEHEFGRFEGDALLLIAAGDKPDGIANSARWAPYISGEVVEVFVPCDHSDMVRPDMLGLVGQAISTWLESA